MKTILTYRRILLYLGFVLVALAVVWLRPWQSLPGPQVSPTVNSTIGMLTGISLIFPAEMDQASVESHLSLQPVIAFHTRWSGHQMTLYPDTAFPANTNIRLQLKKGALSRNGRRYEQDFNWQFHVRQPEIAYLGQATTAPEIWISDLQGRNARQVTQTHGRITSFAALPDGSGFYYSAKNDQGGEDIHRITAVDLRDELVVDCGREICRDPAVSRDGRLLAFSRNRDPIDQTTSPNTYIYTGLTAASNEPPTPLIQEKGISGSLPFYSPDGQKLAFYDANSRGLRIQYPGGSHDFLLGTDRVQRGAWSPEGSKLAFVDDSFDLEDVTSRLYVVDLSSSSISEPFKNILTQVELGEPDWSPDGRQIVAGVRQAGGPVTRQLWLLDFNEMKAAPITSDLTMMNAAPKWNPDGSAIIFQQAQPGLSGAKPRVILWQADNRSQTTVAADAAMPAWLP